MWPILHFFIFYYMDTKDFCTGFIYNTLLIIKFKFKNFYIHNFSKNEKKKCK
jgi:hypothetical protein